MSSPQHPPGANPERDTQKPTPPLADPAAPVLILAAHPDLAHSRVTRALLSAVHAMPTVRVRDLYSLYPDYSIDTHAEQEALREARLLVWLHPMHWYGMPALMKLWVDEVLSVGFAYGNSGHALHGKDLWLVTSTGGSAHAYSPEGYNHHPVEDFLLPYAQTAALCGMRFVPPLLLHSAQKASAEDIQAHARRFVDGLTALPDSSHLQPAPAQEDVPNEDRPAHQEGVPV
ncbi:NAD(P)H-dependent oxidoreductase [Roseateles sp. SL47]|uniref:glutathione-regulated potassium-efflux system oxidoreductase KefF n=1 Tax=Roseateles sp. SL47 TaxID=2995138 RepID=UPI002270F973|nr:NAD(P)H-dependent oxidoreductase [Roseateles sp. SL47]WAC72494.1 NAD(P)H-dependent oxidoreductase [Roseateles sp. SL47]